MPGAIWGNTCTGLPCSEGFKPQEEINHPPSHDANYRLKLVMNVHSRAVAAIVKRVHFVRRERPAEKPFGFTGAHVDTAVTHRCAKILMPICAVKGVARVGKETRPWDAGQFIIVRACEEIAVAHVLGRHFFLNMELAFWRGG